MPRNFSELKSGGTIPMLSPHAEKWGGGTRPPVPHRSTPVLEPIKLIISTQGCKLIEPGNGAVRYDGYLLK